jgi:hypothetical protein
MEWKNLLYLNDKSPVLSNDFYLSKEKTPYSELLENKKSLEENTEEYICRFPARAKYLISKLKLKTKFDYSKCSKLVNWINLLDPESVSIVYPTHSLESSLAVFSHTFIKFNKKEYPKDSRLNVTLSFAAEFNQNDSVIMLGIKGIMGGYLGKFGTSYYYDEINKYSEKDARDIFEYELTLTKSEIEKMLLHVWEVKDTYFSYYFIKENCSYYILALLEVARPSLKLLKFHENITVPSESIKTLTENSNLIKKKEWIPSRKRRQEISTQLLTDKEINIKEEIYLSKNPNILSKKNKKIEKIRKIILLDSIIEESLDKELKSKALRFRAEYSERYTYNYGQYSKLKDFPDQTHGGQLLSLGLHKANKKIGQSLRYRMTLHDFLDPRDGYSQEASVTGLDLKLNIVDENIDNENSSLDFIKMYALKNSLKNIRKYSWKGLSKITKRNQYINFENSISLGPNINMANTNIYLFPGLFTHLSNYYRRGFDFSHGLVFGFNSAINNYLRISSEYIFQRSTFSQIQSKFINTGISISTIRDQAIEIHYNIGYENDTEVKTGVASWIKYF